MDSIPKIIGMDNIPQNKPKHEKKGGHRGPGMFWKHGGERANFVRQAIQKLETGKALVIEFDRPEEKRDYRLMFLNLEKRRTPVKTKSRGLKLYVWLREEQPTLF